MRRILFAFTRIVMLFSCCFMLLGASDRPSPQVVEQHCLSYAIRQQGQNTADAYRLCQRTNEPDSGGNIVFMILGIVFIGGFLFFIGGMVFVFWPVSKEAKEKRILETAVVARKKTSEEHSSSNDKAVLEHLSLSGSIVGPNSMAIDETFVRDIAVIGIETIEKMVSLIPDGGTLDDKIAFVIKFLADLTGENEDDIIRYMGTSLFEGIITTCNGFEVAAVRQGGYYGLYRNVSQGIVPLHANLNVFTMIGWFVLLNRQPVNGASVKSSAITTWYEISEAINSKIHYKRDRRLEAEFLQRSLVAAESSVAVFRKRLSSKSPRRGYTKLVVFAITPIYEMLRNPNKHLLGDLGTLGDFIDLHVNQYPQLHGLMGSLQT